MNTVAVALVLASRSRVSAVFHADTNDLSPSELRRPAPARSQEASTGPQLVQMRVYFDLCLIFLLLRFSLLGRRKNLQIISVDFLLELQNLEDCWQIPGPESLLLLWNINQRIFGCRLVYYNLEHPFVDFNCACSECRIDAGLAWIHILKCLLLSVL